MSKLPISVVILTRDEELNIGPCLDSLVPHYDEVVVVDSGSTDRTVEIAKAKGARVVFHAWPGYPQQWNWAVNELDLKHEFVCTFAADERAPEAFVRETARALRENPNVDLVFTRMKYVWLGKWIRHGGVSESYRERIGRRGKYWFDERAVGEHAILTGSEIYLEVAYVHEDLKPIADWVQKHVKYAQLEAIERLKPEKKQSTFDWQAKAQRFRFLRDRVYMRFPPLVRPFLYFGYRYFWKQGIRDGLTGFSYHFLQGLWFNILVDLFEMELRKRSSLDLETRIPDSGPLPEREPIASSGGNP